MSLNLIKEAEGAGLLGSILMKTTGKLEKTRIIISGGTRVPWVLPERCTCFGGDLTERRDRRPVICFASSFILMVYKVQMI